MVNVLTIDVEEYFHPSEVHKLVDMKHWTNLPSRVEDSTRRVLDLLAERGVTATFFVLGWVARHHPRLVREISAAGHEVGSHGFAHRLIYDLTPNEFRSDTAAAKQAIAEACGVAPRVYRATSFSITPQTLWALEILTECGFTHDSSIYPVKHDRYGNPGFEPRVQLMQTPSGAICEVPIATARIGKNRVVPVGGGAYLRLLPYRYVAAGLRRINQLENRPACVYFHPWELDAGQPRLDCGLLSRLRMYGGLGGMESKVRRLLSEFQFSRLTDVHPAARYPEERL